MEQNLKVFAAAVAKTERLGELAKETAGEAAKSAKKTAEESAEVADEALIVLGKRLVGQLLLGDGEHARDDVLQGL